MAVGHYFVRRGGRVSGPMSAEALRALAASGGMEEQDEWSVDQATWLPGKDMNALLGESGEAEKGFDVFISYSKFNKGEADAVCSHLERRGIRCWIAPRDITPGREWMEAIIDGIERCRAMVLMFSEHANESAQVRREVERAIAKNLPVIPFRLEDVEPARALEYCLGNTHWFEAYDPPLEKHIEELAGIVRRLMTEERVDVEREHERHREAVGHMAGVAAERKAQKGGRTRGILMAAGAALVGGAVTWGILAAWEKMNHGGTPATVSASAREDFEAAEQAYEAERDAWHAAKWSEGFDHSKSTAMVKRVGAELPDSPQKEADYGPAAAAYRKAAAELRDAVKVSEEEERQGVLAEEQAAVDAAAAERLEDWGGAIRAYQRGAALGDGHAMYKLGLYYDSATTGDPDYVKAMGWYVKGAAAGDGDAMAAMGIHYQRGLGVDGVDESKARKWFESAAAAGNERGELYAGLYAWSGRGGAKDFAEALKWFKKAADGGDATAMNYLGLMTLQGEGLDADAAAARTWFLEAAGGGDDDGMVNLAKCYLSGKGGGRDYGEALKWLSKAASSGNGDAMDLVGTIFETGLGVAVDKGTAAEWYRRAAEAGSEEGATDWKRLAPGAATQGSTGGGA